MGYKKDEVIRIRSSRKVYIPLYLMFMILLVSVYIYYKKTGSLNNPGVIATAVFIILGIKYTELHRLRNSWDIDFGHITHNKGLINISSKRVDFFAISDIDISQNLWQRLINYGNVNVHLFSKDYILILKSISNPNEFAKTLENRIMAKRRISNMSGGGQGGNR